MSIPALIAGGLGFTQGTRFIPTRGLGSATVVTLVWADRVHQTSTTAGTGNLTLSGTPNAKRAFASVMAPGEVCYGFAASQTANEWEVNTFIMQADGTLARGATPLASSNGGALVAFTGTLLDVVLDVPAKVIFESVSTPGYTAALR